MPGCLGTVLPAFWGLLILSFGGDLSVFFGFLSGLGLFLSMLVLALVSSPSILSASDSRLDLVCSLCVGRYPYNSCRGVVVASTG